jgi:hypothetical protein
VEAGDGKERHVGDILIIRFQDFDAVPGPVRKPKRYPADAQLGLTRERPPRNDSALEIVPDELLARGRDAGRRPELRFVEYRDSVSIRLHDLYLP